MCQAEQLDLLPRSLHSAHLVLGDWMAKQKILIIEDNLEIAIMVDDLMREQGYHTAIAYNGQTGLDLALKERPDLILLDLRLPQMSGVDLLQALKDQNCVAPVVVMTAAGSEELAIQALRLGVQDYIKKPFNAPKLLEVTHRALEEDRLRNENAQFLEDLQESRDRVAERGTELKTVLNKLVKLQRAALGLGALTVGADMKDVYRQLTEYAVSLLDVRQSCILLFDSDRHELLCQHPAFGLSDAIAKNYRIPLGPDSPIWGAWQNGQSLIANDLSHSPLLQALGRSARAVLTGVRSTMFAVLRLGERSVGFFQVSDKTDGSDFTTNDLRLLEIVASQSAIAIENARLFTFEKHRVAEMETLVEVAQAVSEAVDDRPQPLLERIARGACEILQGDAALILPILAGDSESYDVSNAASYGTSSRVTFNPAIDERDPVNILRYRNPLVCEDIVHEQPDLLRFSYFRQESARAVVGLLLEDDEVELGVLYVVFHDPRAFNQRELTSVRLMAHQATLAIAKSRLFEMLNRHVFRTNTDLMRKLQEIEELKRISRLISSTPEIDQIYSNILQGAMAISGAPHAALLMMDEQHRAVVAHVRRDGQIVTEKVDLHAYALDVPARGPSPAAPQDAAQTLMRRTPWLSIYRHVVPDARSYLYAPVMSGNKNERIGILAIGSPEPTKFGPDDLRLLEALANQAAVANQNARYAQAANLTQDRRSAAGAAAAQVGTDGSLVHRINYTVGAIPALIQQIELGLEQGTLETSVLREKLRGIRDGADLALEMLQQIRTVENNHSD
jgi:GAF domain-containing protein/DNA-binding NarL/FixJ family response regulator